MDEVMNDCEAAPDGAMVALGTVLSNTPYSHEEAATLSALWTELTSGLCKVLEVNFDARHCTIVVIRAHRSSDFGSPRLTTRDLQILERSLTEGVRKSVAADFNLCPSSVAEILRRCFAFMGLSCWPSRIPLVIVMAAHAHRAARHHRAAQLVLAQNQHFSRQTISVTRPDNEISRCLSPAEFAVTRMLIEGKSYVDIAAHRNTSKRTVANQLAAAFQRLHISGRPELLCLLSQGALEQPRPAVRSTRSVARSRASSTRRFVPVAAVGHAPSVAS